MKMKELMDQTGVSRQTVHYYLREGLLQQSEKTNSNQAEYGPQHVERLHLIKELQERFFLPLLVIKGVIANMQEMNRSDSTLRVKAEYFNPREQFMPERIQGEQAFLSETGMTAERLADFERYGIISPTVTRLHKIYSQDDISIGRAIGTMRRIGLSHDKGFPRDGLKQLKKTFEKVVAQFGEIFVEKGSPLMSLEDLQTLQKPATEVMAVFFYHLFRRLSREDVTRRITAKQGTTMRPRKGVNRSKPNPTTGSAGKTNPTPAPKRQRRRSHAS
jgi:DNA-binding transcriptional MerR regulator